LYLMNRIVCGVLSATCLVSNDFEHAAYDPIGLNRAATGYGHSMLTSLLSGT